MYMRCPCPESQQPTTTFQYWSCTHRHWPLENWGLETERLLWKIYIFRISSHISVLYHLIQTWVINAKAIITTGQYSHSSTMSVKHTFICIMSFIVFSFLVWAPILISVIAPFLLYLHLHSYILLFNSECLGYKINGFTCQNKKHTASIYFSFLCLLHITFLNTCWIAD